MRRLRILTVCAEFAPLAKVGGLGDVTAGLTRYLCAQGHEVLVALPLYGVIDRSALDMTAAPVAPLRELILGGRPIHASLRRVAHAASGATLCLVDCPEFFAGEVYATGEVEAWRFMLLCRAALDGCRMWHFEPDIVHCHDWHAAPAAVLLKGNCRSLPEFRHSYTVLTVHNIGYQGAFPLRVIEQSDYAPLRPLFPVTDLTHLQVNFLRAGITHADALTTVSPTHAREIQTPEFGKGLDTLLRQRRHRLAGILNGVDYSQWNPEKDELIPARYSVDDLRGKRRCREVLLSRMGLAADATTPVLGFVSRLTDQKGIDIVVHALPRLLNERPLVCTILGSGERRYVQALRSLAAGFPGRVKFHEGYDEQAAHTIIAGSDLLMVPSLYEPCGLTQMYAMRYGTVPVVRATGGLADTVQHFDPATGHGTGSVFRDADVGGLCWGLTVTFGWFADRDRWLRLMRNGMLQDFSWDRQGPKYEEIFTRLAGDVPAGRGP